MSTQTSRSTPNPLERVEYLCGKHLPESMHEWVVRDTSGPGHNRRYFTRGLLLFLPLVIAIALIPAPLWVKLTLILIVMLPAMYFVAGLRRAYLDELMLANDVDPHTESGRQLAEHHRRDTAYAQRYRSGG